MQSPQFYHWLEGIFELYTPTSFNESQTATIKKNVDLVLQNDSKPSNFCIQLAGYFAYAKPTILDTQATEVLYEKFALAANDIKELPPLFQTKSETGLKPRC